MMNVLVHWKPAPLVRVGDRALPLAFDMEMKREDGRPDLLLGFEVRAGVPQCRRAELRSTDTGREVLSSDLRGVKIEDLIEDAVLQVAMLIRQEARGSGQVTVIRPVASEDDRRDSLRQVQAIRREARRRITPEFLQDVARVYRENISHNPTSAVADFTGKSHRAAALYVQKAREAGYLGQAIRGRAGEQEEDQ